MIIHECEDLTTVFFFFREGNSDISPSILSHNFDENASYRTIDYLGHLTATDGEDTEGINNG